MTATKQTMTNADVYERVTANIIEAMEKGVVPWQRGWTGATGMPVNALTRRPYNGVNVLALWMTAMSKGYSCDGWLTFNAARKHGMMVRKGEKATPVIYMKRLAKKNKETGEEESVFLARLFYVFNLEQVDDQKGHEGTKERLRVKLEGKAAEGGAGALAEFDAMVKRTKAKIRHEGNAAYYAPLEDRVTMPSKATFVSTEAYYATLSHELAHWTGHPSRLGRYEVSAGRWSRTNGLDRAQEELIAELSAAFTCARLGVEHISQAASYLKSWLSHLNDDKRFLVKAASEASKATNHLLGVDTGEEESDDEE